MENLKHGIVGFLSKGVGIWKRLDARPCVQISGKRIFFLEIFEAISCDNK